MSCGVIVVTVGAVGAVVAVVIVFAFGAVDPRITIVFYVHQVQGRNVTNFQSLKNL